MQVFISHSSIDKPIAIRIKEQLESIGVNTWLDDAEIRVGDSIPDKVAEGLKESEIICILLSQNSVQSFWVKRELNAFLPQYINGNKVILPCKLDNSEVPYLISDIKYADFTNSFESGFKDLLRAFSLNEEVKLIEDSKRLKILLMKQLSKAELAYTIFRIYEKSKAGYFIGDRRYQAHPYDLLGKLNSIGFFDVTLDRYERDYSYTKEALKAIEMLYKEERILIEQLRNIYES